MCACIKTAFRLITEKKKAILVNYIAKKSWPKSVERISIWRRLKDNSSLSTLEFWAPIFFPKFLLPEEEEEEEEGLPVIRKSVLFPAIFQPSGSTDERVL